MMVPQAQAWDSHPERDLTLPREYISSDMPAALPAADFGAGAEAGLYQFSVPSLSQLQILWTLSATTDPSEMGRESHLRRRCLRGVVGGSADSSS